MLVQCEVAKLTATGVSPSLKVMARLQSNHIRQCSLQVRRGGNYQAPRPSAPDARHHRAGVPTVELLLSQRLRPDIPDPPRLACGRHLEERRFHPGQAAEIACKSNPEHDLSVTIGYTIEVKGHALLELEHIHFEITVPAEGVTKYRRCGSSGGR